MRTKKITFDTRKVAKIFGKKAGTALKRFGAFTRRVAKSSIKKARQKKASELTKEQKESYKRALALYKDGRIKEKPIRGWQSSEPRQAPRWHPGGMGGKSPLRELILFEYNKADQSVVVGPKEFRTAGGTKGVGALEKGGKAKKQSYQRRAIRMKKRPFMVPAMKKGTKQLLRGFK